jgi:hypothetical protein
MVGGFVTIVDVVRIVYLEEPLKEEREIDPSGGITATKRPANFFYYASFSLMWLSVEVSVGIMCCCVLVLKPLVKRVNSSPQARPSRTSVPTSPTIRDPSKPSTSTRYPGPPVRGVNRSDGVAHLTSNPRHSRIDSPVSTRPPTLSSIPEQPGNDDKDGTMDFFEILASETPPEAPHAPLPPLQATQSRGKSTPRGSTIPSHRRDALQTVPSQAPPQTFSDFVNVTGKVPLTQLSAKEAWWPIMFGKPCPAT